MHGVNRLEYSNTEKRLKKESLSVNKETHKKEAYAIRDTTASRAEPQGVLPTMAYTGRLRAKVVPFEGLRYMKGYSDFPG